MPEPTTPRERFIAALERRPLNGLVPHFELVFFLTMEAFGKVHPSQRHYAQWDQMEEKERALHRREMADIYLMTAERFGHSAIFIHPNPESVDETQRLIDLIREKSGDRYFIMRHGDPTYSIPDGAGIARFAERMADEPEKLHAEAQQRVDDAIRKAEKWAKKGGLDGFALCADYCFNTGPFLSPRWFADLITPYLAQVTKAYRDMGYYVIKHTDGNILPILDQLLQTNPHALHSLDPQGGVDMKEIKRLAGGQVCLCGNVNCAMLDTGSDEQIVEATRYALHNGMPGGGYIFATSNCIYTGMPLRSYEIMLDVWRKEGIYA